MHTPPVEAYSPSTTSSLRWSRRITPSGGPEAGGLTAFTCTPASRIPFQKDRGTSRQPNQSWSTRTRALLSLCRQRVGEPVSDFVVLEDVVVQVDPMLRPRNGREPVVVGVRAVFEQREAIALPERRIANPTQDPFQTCAARCDIVRDGKVVALDFSLLCQGRSSLRRFGLYLSGSLRNHLASPPDGPQPPWLRARSTLSSSRKGRRVPDPDDVGGSLFTPVSW